MTSLPTPGCVHLWHAPLHADDATLAMLRSQLNAQEQARADRIRIAKPRRQFIVARSLLRRLVGGYLDMRPTDVELTFGERGKPAVIDAVNPGNLRFNLSHSHERVIYALTREQEIGGQMNLARSIPGKSEFNETIRYFRTQLDRLQVQMRLGEAVTATDLADQGYDEIIVAAGVRPRRSDISGSDGPNVLSYLDVLRGLKPVGDRVAIIGAGGIGFDVAVFLTHREMEQDEFLAAWGVDRDYAGSGGLDGGGSEALPAHTVTLLQRKTSKPGAGLGKTTGWITRTSLKRAGVRMLAGVQYDRIDGEGVHITREGKRELIEADTVVVCAGQEPESALAAALEGLGESVHLIGGADVARELDAQRAIDQGARLAAAL